MTVVCTIAFALFSHSANAQQASGIAGVVRDASGAVLPGVTVDASSTALIEKTRSAVTDGEGRYSIVGLLPGTYGVQFTLQGFRTQRREGIELTAGFTAAVNTDLQVGALDETITVSGASPLVDTQNVRKQIVVSKELLDTLPVSTQTITSAGQI
ncbi:MAG TPA: carboxypeptidase-like regulatory domain-containing protein [Vicinamibacterales bacterium]|nr:carboxypeptidase-like regulatory domain-containing protein [Vicinamibacterales bacterium]